MGRLDQPAQPAARPEDEATGLVGIASGGGHELAEQRAIAAVGAQGDRVEAQLGQCLAELAQALDLGIHLAHVLERLVAQVQGAGGRLRPRDVLAHQIVDEPVGHEPETVVDPNSGLY